MKTTNTTTENNTTIAAVEKERTFLTELVTLQNEYTQLVKDNKATNAALTRLTMAFRHEYELTELQTNQLVRNELSIAEINSIIESHII